MKEVINNILIGMLSSRVTCAIIIYIIFALPEVAKWKKKVYFNTKRLQQVKAKLKSDKIKNLDLRLVNNYWFLLHLIVLLIPCALIISGYSEVGILMAAFINSLLDMIITSNFFKKTNVLKNKHK